MYLVHNTKERKITAHTVLIGLVFWSSDQCWRESKKGIVAGGRKSKIIENNFGWAFFKSFLIEWTEDDLACWNQLILIIDWLKFNGFFFFYFNYNNHESLSYMVIITMVCAAWLLIQIIGFFLTNKTFYLIKESKLGIAKKKKVIRPVKDFVDLMKVWVFKAKCITWFFFSLNNRL